MRHGTNQYLDAARSDVDKLEEELEEVRRRFSRNPEGNGLDSDLVETAWSDLKDQWQKLQASGTTASVELRNSYEDARQRFRRVLDTYHKS